MQLMNTAARARGGNVDAANLLETWVRSNPAFENVVSRDYWIPMSPWLKPNNIENVRWNAIATIMKEDIKVSFWLF